MVDFHDRRRVALTAPKEAPDLHSGSGVFLSRKVINDCFVISSEAGPLTKGQRMYAIHEVLPSGETVRRMDGYPTPYAAKRDAREMEPSSVRPLR
ncbi:hypothetical protein [Terracoccus sp. 273MFTsu3.1]|uniref:hypothetical protein n=1 Tax=Terracoccus sp. 273MFTsu3.1 TaxID=1172188 RepID=UPI00037D6608|nr:hypothetical protein [Terracoccus sp. 273MFTsu3.1]